MQSTLSVTFQILHLVVAIAVYMWPTYSLSEESGCVFYFVKNLMYGWELWRIPVPELSTDVMSSERPFWFTLRPKKKDHLFAVTWPTLKIPTNFGIFIQFPKNKKEIFWLISGFINHRAFQFFFFLKNMKTFNIFCTFEILYTLFICDWHCFCSV